MGVISWSTLCEILKQGLAWELLTPCAEQQRKPFEDIYVPLIRCA